MTFGRAAAAALALLVLLAAALFLEANGVRFAVAEEEAVVRMLALATDTLTVKDFAAWLRQACCD